MRRLAIAVSLALIGCGGDSAPLGIDESAMDRRVDPCQDFYRYACGGYVDSHPVGADGAFVSRSSQAFFAAELDSRTILKEAVNTQSGDEGAALLAAFNDACVSGGSNLDRTYLDSLIGRVETIQTLADVPRVLAALHEVGVGALFGFGGTRDLMNASQVIAVIAPGGTGLPDRSYYLDSESVAVRTAYRAHMVAMTSKAGHIDPGLPDAVLDIETALAAAMLENDQRRDPMAVYHIQPLTALAQAVPAFDFDAYLEAAEAPSFTELNVMEPVFFDTLQQLLSQTPIEDLKRYLRWRIIESFASTLDDGILAEEYHFHAGTFLGFTTPLARSEYCLRATASSLSMTMSRLYVARLSKVVPTAAGAMVDRLRTALRGELAAVGWLDEPTRAAAIAKLDAIRIGVFAPADFSPYEVTIRESFGDYPTAVSLLRKATRARSLALIGGMDSREWFLSPITVNAAYGPTLNAINVPAAILQKPFFDVEFPEAVNLGSMGAIIGHELTHGFDDQGRKFDAGGALTDWWTPSVATQFETKAQCLVDQYSVIEGVPGVHIDGELTLGENIADVGGVKLAHAALHPTGQRIGDYTDAQVFFLSYAQSWCSNTRPEALASRLRTDTHSPAEARVNAVLADTPEFAAAFACAPGAKMVSPAPCAVW